MPLILAIEPDRRQAAQLSVVVRKRVHAELILVDTTERALDAIGNRMPDLVLVPALLSPQDDAALAAALRVIAAAARVQMLTIPVLGAPRPAAGGGRCAVGPSAREAAGGRARWMRSGRVRGTGRVVPRTGGAGAAERPWRNVAAITPVDARRPIRSRRVDDATVGIDTAGGRHRNRRRRTQSRSGSNPAAGAEVEPTPSNQRSRRRPTRASRSPSRKPCARCLPISAPAVSIRPNRTDPPRSASRRVGPAPAGCR